VEGERLIGEQYTRMALVYEERVVPRFLPIARRTVDLAGLREGERALDVGCGTGLATLLAAQAVGPRGEVVGVDFAEGQLGIAEGKRRLQRVEQARFARADATRLASSAEFDAALSNLGVPPDFAACFAGMRRALRPHGRLSVVEWAAGSMEPWDTFAVAVERHRVADPGPELAALRQAVGGRRAQFERIGTEAGMRDALEHAGFRQVQARVEERAAPFRGWRDAYDFCTAWGSREAEVRAMTGPEREALHAELREAWGDGPFTLPWRLVHGTAQA
jgi:ubiquinone/menaquinone biosynthesis C-methylase UbiE